MSQSVRVNLCGMWWWWWHAMLEREDEENVEDRDHVHDNDNNQIESEEQRMRENRIWLGQGKTVLWSILSTNQHLPSDWRWCSVGQSNLVDVKAQSTFFSFFKRENNRLLFFAPLLRDEYLEDEREKKSCWRASRKKENNNNLHRRFVRLHLIELIRLALALIMMNCIAKRQREREREITNKFFFIHSSTAYPIKWEEEMKITWINTHTIWLQMKPSHRSFSLSLNAQRTHTHNTRSSQIEKRAGKGMHADNEPFSIEENNRWIEVTLCTTGPPDIYTSMDTKAMMFSSSSSDSHRLAERPDCSSLASSRPSSRYICMYISPSACLSQRVCVCIYRSSQKKYGKKKR